MHQILCCFQQRFIDQYVRHQACCQGYGFGKTGAASTLRGFAGAGAASAGHSGSVLMVTPHRVVTYPYLRRSGEEIFLAHRKSMQKLKGRRSQAERSAESTPGHWNACGEATCESEH